MKKTIIASMAVSALSLTTMSHAMTSLDDHDLSQVSGQALLNLQNISGVSSGSMNQSNMGFYRLSLEGQLSLNANIKKLQLGCGGSKGSGCDIDIDNISLTGIPTSTAVGAGVDTDFILNNPFIEFAIDNPNSASTRSVAGFRLGALSALGVMSIGSNTDLNSTTDDTGINSLSGDIGVRVTNASMNSVYACLLGVKSSGTGCNGLGLPTDQLTGTATVADYSTTLIARRASSFNLKGMTAQASSSLLGLKLTNVNMNNIPYATTHQLMVASRDSNGNYVATGNASLSLQAKDIYWQNVSDGSWRTIAAEKGWWMSIPDTQFNNLSVNQTVYLSAFGAIGGAILGTEVNLAAVDLGQLPVSNCYGGMKFC